jgi:hypothetical protein
MRKNLLPALSSSSEELSLPLDMSDILSACKDYSKLGWQIQNQIEEILDLGVEEAMMAGLVSATSLPHIREFLKQIAANPLWEEAGYQANEAIGKIDEYLEKYPSLSFAN